MEIGALYKIESNGNALDRVVYYSLESFAKYVEFRTVCEWEDGDPSNILIFVGEENYLSNRGGNWKIYKFFYGNKIIGILTNYKFTKVEIKEI